MNLNDNPGLLWYDESSLPLAAKLQRAAVRYREKHGGWPNVCYLHPSALVDAPESVTLPETVVQLKAARNVWPKYMRLEVEGE